MVAFSCVGPLHAGGKIIEFIGVELVLVSVRYTFERLLPVGPGVGLAVGRDSELMTASPANLCGVIGVVQAVGHHVKKAGSIALHTPQELGIDLAQSTFTLNKLLVFTPVGLA